MNAIPQPADLSKLKGILGNAKAVMNKVNNGDYQPGSVDGSMVAQDTSGYLDEGAMQGAPTQAAPQMGNPVRQPGQISEHAINNSNLPAAVKQAMIDNPIVQSNPMMGQSFNLDDVSDLIDKPMPQARPAAARPKPLNENVMQQGNDKFTVSEAALRGIIKDVLVEYLAADYSKNLTEGVIKKTINTLIKEGKIKTKK